jgi:CheY-like chemotaxis protein
MDNPTILVADGDPKNLQILRESLEASGFEVIVASDGLQAWQKISSDVPDLILSEVNLPKLDGFQLLEKLKADPVTSTIPLMFLTNRRELQDRVRSLRGGVKDYMIKPLHVKEVIARVRMILRRMERIREEEVESTRKLAGRLEEFSVIDLIENFGMERKTGILTLYNANNKSGEIYFRDGAVINASLANLKAEKAVYQMLPWKRGHFTMTFKELNVPDEIAVSNLGLLLQGFKRMEERERLFKMLPSPEATFVTTETFRNIIVKRELTTDVVKFISLIDGKRDILQVIDESNYDDIKTLERLVKLYQQGFIKPSKTSLASDDEMSEMVSTIAEPKIVEKLDFDPAVEQRFAGRPAEKEMPPENRPAMPQAFRRPDILPYVPPERKPKETPAISVETKHEVPIPTRPATPIKPPVTKLPPPTEIITSDSESFGEDLQPEDLPATTIKRIEKTPAEFAELKARDDRQEPVKPATLKAEEREILPIDLGNLMQRPTAPPPIFDKPVAPRQPLPLEYQPPKKIEKTEEVSPVAKIREDQSSVPAQPTVLEILDAFIPTPSNEVSTRAPEIDKFEPTSETKPIERQTPVEPPELLPELKTKAIEIESPEEMETALKHLQMPSAPPAPQVPESVQMRSEIPVAPPAPQVIVPAPMASESVAPALSQPPITAPVLHGDLITNCLAQLLMNRPAAKPKLVIIGREGLHVSPMVRSLLGSESSLRRLQSANFQYLEIGERKVESQPFEIIGISMEQQFTRLLDTAGPDLIGYIVMIEAYRKERMEYLSYLLNMLKNVYRRPLGIAVIKSAEQKNMSADTLRDLLNISQTDFLQDCTPTDKLSVAEFLKGFTSEGNLQRCNADGKNG